MIGDNEAVRAPDLAARIGMDVGLPAVSDTIRRLGYEGPLNQLPSMLLGTMDMSPMEVAGMYHTIAAEGFYTPLRAISAVYTADNQQLKNYPFSTEQRFKPLPAYLDAGLISGLAVPLSDRGRRGRCL